MSSDGLGVYLLSVGVRGSQQQYSYPSYLSAEESRVASKDVHDIFRCLPIFLSSEVVGEEGSGLFSEKVYTSEFEKSREHCRNHQQCEDCRRDDRRESDLCLDSAQDGEEALHMVSSNGQSVLQSRQLRKIASGAASSYGMNHSLFSQLGSKLHTSLDSLHGGHGGEDMEMGSGTSVIGASAMCSPSVNVPSTMTTSTTASSGVSVGNQEEMHAVDVQIQVEGEQQQQEDDSSLSAQSGINNGINNSVNNGVNNGGSNVTTTNNTPNNNNPTFNKNLPHALGIIPCDSQLRVLNAQFAQQGVLVQSMHHVQLNVVFLVCTFLIPTASASASASVSTTAASTVASTATSTAASTTITILVALRSDARSRALRTLQTLQHIGYQQSQAPWQSEAYESNRRLGLFLDNLIANVRDQDGVSTGNSETQAKMWWTLLYDALTLVSPQGRLLQKVLRVCQNVDKRDRLVWEHPVERWGQSLYKTAYSTTYSTTTQTGQSSDPMHASTSNHYNTPQLASFTTLTVEPHMLSSVHTKHQASYLRAISQLPVTRNASSLGWSSAIQASVSPFCTVLPLLAPTLLLRLHSNMIPLIKSQTVIASLQEKASCTDTNYRAQWLGLLQSLRYSPLTIAQIAEILHQDNDTACQYRDPVCNSPCALCTYTLTTLLCRGVLQFYSPLYCIPTKHLSIATTLQLRVLCSKPWRVPQLLRELSCSYEELTDR